MSKKSKNILEVYQDWLPYIIIAIGILLRIVVFIQNRSLEVDEANIARNIYERDFVGLLEPLSYQQFAPPGFLWSLDLFTNLLGYGEQAFRLFALISGIISLWLFYKVLRYFVTNAVSWYALAIMATGYIYLYYATEVKQYSSDVAIALCLILLALKTDIKTVKPSKFFFLWVGAGLLAMWFSMPAVFILAGVGLYYMYPLFRERSSGLSLAIGTALTWLAMFAGYYYLFLVNGVESENLKMYHASYFIELIPSSAAERAKTIAVLKLLFSDATGKETIAIVFNSLLFFTGSVVLVLKQKAKAFLLLTPVVALYIAAAFEQFTLLSRVVLFIMPVLLLIISVGFQFIFNIPNIAPKIVIIILALVNLNRYNELKRFYEPLLFEEIKDALDEVKAANIPPEHLHVNILLEPALMYYTTIHPDKDNWEGYADAYLLPWADNYDPVAENFTRDAVLYGWYPQDRMYNEFQSYNKYCFLQKIDVYGMQLYICTSRQRR